MEDENKSNNCIVIIGCLKLQKCTIYIKMCDSLNSIEFYSCGNSRVSKIFATLNNTTVI